MSDKPPSLTTPPDGYSDWLTDLKDRIHHAQQRASLAVNRELIQLYWQIGQDILQRQAEQGWGAKVIERLAHDLRTAFPEMKGFSRSTSCICAPLPKPGRMPRLSNRLLDNCCSVLNRLNASCRPGNPD